MHRHTATIAAVALAAGAFSLALAARVHAAASGAASPPAGAAAAPEIPPGLDWLNTATPLTMASLRGKVVLLDFWTYGCINCMHDFPWIRRLEKDFPDTLVVIGVHSSKFSEEGNTRNIRQIVLRYGIDYPVVNDSRFEVWNEWRVSAWPTLAIIDPAGNIAAERAGEGFYPEFRRIIAALTEEFGARGLLDRRPLKLKLEREGLPQTVLSFPGKVRVDASGNRLFISDTGHDRLVIAAPDTGRVLAVVGDGSQGFRDGDFATAEFDHPQGTALSAAGDVLYVADTGNHAIREVDLRAHRVTTLVGTGAQAVGYPPAGGTAPAVALSSPWDLALAGRDLYIAMAGSHQIWRMDLATKRVEALAGTGAEGYDDGPFEHATLAQPSGLSIGPDGRLYVADAEESSIRVLDLATRRVSTLAGADDSLFHFGLHDGFGHRARFQHPLGVVAHGGTVYVADTYNSRIREIDPGGGRVTTLRGGGVGWRDGASPSFYEPGGIDAANGRLYVADTNNHAIREIDLAHGVTSTLVLKGIPMLAGGGVYGERVVRLPELTVTPGTGSLLLAVGFPAGFGVNLEAPSEAEVSSSGGAVTFTGTREFRGAGPRFPLSFPATFARGEAEVTVGLSLVYCREEQASLCMIERSRLEVPVRVIEAGTGSTGHPVLEVRYDVP